jgi:hypothetical protein
VVKEHYYATVIKENTDIPIGEKIIVIKMMDLSTMGMSTDICTVLYQNKLFELYSSYFELEPEDKEELEINGHKKSPKELYEQQEKELSLYSDLFLLAHDAILREFEKISPISEKYFVDGYGLFYSGSNSVCHFKLKKYPLWKFGIWLDYEKGENKNDIGSDIINVQMFAQVENFIDKFKPSASSFISNFSFAKPMKYIEESGEFIRSDDFSFEVSNYYIDKFNLIWTQPSLAIIRDISYEDYNRRYLSPLKAFLLVKEKFGEEKQISNREEKARKFYYKSVEKWIKKNLNNSDILSCEIKDEGNNVHPRYYLAIYVTEDFSDEDVENINDSFWNCRRNINEKLEKMFKNKYCGFESFQSIRWFIPDKK